MMNADRPVRARGAASRLLANAGAFFLVTTLLVMFLGVPALAASSASPDGGAHAGGEANLVLPDLDRAEFMGLRGRTLLMLG